MGVCLYEIIVPLKNAQKKLMLGMSDGFDDKAIVTREIEERTGFAWRAELGENVSRSQGEEVVGRIKTEDVLP